jgi:holo-[acyl-carrier protein] synthase
MIFGIGNDVCDLRRMAATLERRGDRFAEKVLGPNELSVFRDRRAKVEARSKAIGLGLHHPMTWRDCETLNHPGGQPYIQLHGALAEWFAARHLRAHVTLSDETDYAVSFVVVETNT